jgi:hypothetical protein
MEEQHTIKADPLRDPYIQLEFFLFCVSWIDQVEHYLLQLLQRYTWQPFTQQFLQILTHLDSCEHLYVLIVGPDGISILHMKPSRSDHFCHHLRLLLERLNTCQLRLLKFSHASAFRVLPQSLILPGESKF